MKRLTALLVSLTVLGSLAALATTGCRRAPSSSPQAEAATPHVHGDAAECSPVVADRETASSAPHAEAAGFEADRITAEAREAAQTEIRDDNVEQVLAELEQEIAADDDTTP